ncbi:MAG: pentapeptide repeat-containing protein [Bacteroidota bacterium]
MEATENEKYDANILIEAKLLEQEHRPPRLILNYINREKNYPNEDDPRRKAVQHAIIWRFFFSPAVLALGGSTLLGAFTAFVLWYQTDIFNDQTIIFKEQTNIIQEQKSLLEEQNRKIEIQARLEDANRRNNLVFLMDNVLNRVADELKTTVDNDSSLSKPLLARIQALGLGLQPYKFINYTLKNSSEKDSLGLTQLLSPERGQLLLSIVNSGIGKRTIESIYKNTPFSNADLAFARLNKVFLARISLDNANLSSVKLREANLFRANLKNANLLKASLSKANLSGADVSDTNLSGADLYNANLYDANLSRANLTNANIATADLSDADLSGANLSGANLTEANLYGVNLQSADLREADLSGVNLENIVSIDSCIVHRKDWLIEIRDWYELKGAAVLVEKYKVEAYKNGDFIVVKK